MVNLDEVSDKRQRHTFLYEADAFIQVSRKEGDVDEIKEKDLIVTSEVTNSEKHLFKLKVKIGETNPQWSADLLIGVENLTDAGNNLPIQFKKLTETEIQRLEKDKIITDLSALSAEGTLKHGTPDVPVVLKVKVPSIVIRRKNSTNREELNVQVEKWDSKNKKVTLKINENKLKPISAVDENDFQTVLTYEDVEEVEESKRGQIETEVEVCLIRETIPVKSTNKDAISLAEPSIEDFKVVFENLRKLDDVSIIAFPDMVKASDKGIIQSYIRLGYEYCYEREFCFFIIDPPDNRSSVDDIKNFVNGNNNRGIDENKNNSLEYCYLFEKDQNLNYPLSPKEEDKEKESVSESGLNKYSAIYFPWIKVIDPGYNPYTDDESKKYKFIPPSGAIAGKYARIDDERGVWKAPAGIRDGILSCARDVQYHFSEKDYGYLNCRYINAIRKMNDGNVCLWGARTVAFLSSSGGDCEKIKTQWKYLNIRRLFNYIEESLYKGIQWVVFEPNGPELWGLVKRDITLFLTEQWKDGALAGSAPDQAFFVKVDKDNNPQSQVREGLLYIDVGIAPLYPAEFVILRMAQKTLPE